MRKFCIVHFQPLEKYPPVVNFLRFLAEDRRDYKVDVMTTGTADHHWQLTVSGTTIKRLVWWKPSANRAYRLLQYIIFNVISFLRLIWLRPSVVLYYESLSSFAPRLYKKWINRKASIFIHYHEYTSKDEYRQGMVMNRRLHNKEVYLYKDAWVSHTNETRMKLFLEDMGSLGPRKTHIVPNYPPALWYQVARTVKRTPGNRIGFVYVGALSLEALYTCEMARFIASRPDECYWDIYSDNHQPEVLQFLQELDAPNIFFKGAVPYDKLPYVLPAYDIGVILYKGIIPNYIHNAPNKLFEYLVCGLNVWYPVVMQGVKPFERNLKPWVKGVEFTALSLPDPVEARRLEEVTGSNFHAGVVYKTFWDTIATVAENEPG